MSSSNQTEKGLPPPGPSQHDTSEYGKNAGPAAQPGNSRTDEFYEDLEIAIIEDDTDDPAGGGSDEVKAGPGR